MGRYIGPVCRLCRREGDETVLERRKVHHEMHSWTGEGNLQDSTANCEAQANRIWQAVEGEAKTSKRIYNVREEQFVRYFEMATKMPGNTGENFLQLLERQTRQCQFIGWVLPFPATTLVN
jgi:small subunit ribosomal protein S4